MKVKLKKDEKLSSSSNYCNLAYKDWVALNQGKSVELSEIPKRIEDKIEISKNSDHFSNDDLQARWKEMNSNFSNKGKTNLVLALNSNKPVLKENYVVEVTLSNTSQVELLNEEKLNILGYLREKMNNDSIDIIANVVQSNKNDTPYTKLRR